MKLFCVKCKKFMRPKKNGVVIEEKMVGNQPYKLWMADEIECPSCGFSVVSGWAMNPLAEHFQDDYFIKRAKAIENNTFYEEII